MISTRGINTKYAMKFINAFFLMVCGLTYQVQAQNQKQLAEYFKTVHQAAVAVCKRDLDGAKLLYSSAIKNARYSNATDLNNAIYAEVYSASTDTPKVITYLKQMQVKGICVHERYKRRPKISPYTKLIPESGCKKVKSETDRLLVEKMTTQYEAVSDSLKRVSNSSEMARVRLILDSANYQILSGVLDRALLQNMPLEEYIGSAASGEALTIIFRYSRQKFDAAKIFKLVEAGILDPRSVSMRYDESIERGYIGAPIPCKNFYPFGTNMIFQTSPEIIIKIPPEPCLAGINKLRNKYYLPDIIEECKIKAYAQYNAVNGFVYGHTALSVDKAMFTKMVAGISKKYKIIKYDGPEDFNFDRKF